MFLIYWGVPHIATTPFYNYAKMCFILSNGDLTVVSSICYFFHFCTQSEVESLAKANAKTQKSLFTTYLLPDAHTFCMCLHIVKKLINTEQFVIIVAKSGT